MHEGLTLNDVCELIVDSEHKTASTQDEGIPYVRTPDIGEGRLNLSNVKRISEDSYKEWTKRAVPQVGDLILAREAPVGNVAIITVSEKVCLGQRTVLMRPDRRRVDPNYLVYFMLGDYVQNTFHGVSSGATVPHLNMSDIRTLSLPELPSLEIQRIIGNILSAYDDLIESNRCRIRLLEEMARALYREWFVHFRFPGHEEVEMVDSELGEIPEGWEVRHLSEMVSTQYGYTESTQEEEVGPKYVRGMDINKTSYITWDSVPYCRIDTIASERYKLNERDILVIRMADPGKVAIIEKDIEAVFASYLIRLKIKDGSMLPYFLFYTLSAKHYQDFISAASTGTTRKSASAPLITNYNVVVPTRDVMDKFEVFVQSLRRLLNNLLDQNAVLRRSRDLLLPRFISGQIDVSDLKIEIPTDTHQTPKYSDQSTLDQWPDGDSKES